MKKRPWITPLFLTLVAIEALLVVLQRTDVDLPVSGRVMGIARLFVAVAIIGVIVVWSLMEWKSRDTSVE
jgi:hypothetical protein